MNMNYIYSAQVERVLDGDSAVLLIDQGFHTFRREKVRFMGIDAPETRTRDTEEKKRGLAVKKYVKELIEGKNIQIESHKQGKFGRFLVTIFVDGMNLNQHLIDTERALEYYGGKR